MQSLYHGSEWRFPPDEIIAGADGLIHLHANPLPVQVSYEQMYHYALDRSLDELPFITDQGTWELDTMLWELNTLNKILTSADCDRINERAKSLSNGREALYDTLIERGLVGFRYINAYEFPGLSVALFDDSALLPTEDYDGTYGKSFLSDFEESWNTLTDNAFMVTSYCSSVITHETFGHWPKYLNEFAELLTEIRQSYKKDGFGDPDSDEEVARTVAEYNNIPEDAALKGIAFVRKWQSLHPKGYREGDSPFSLKPITEDRPAPKAA